jgi:hypothetical protein
VLVNVKWRLGLGIMGARFFFYGFDGMVFG